MSRTWDSFTVMYITGTDGADSGIGDVFPGAADDEGAVDVEEDDTFFHGGALLKVK